MLVGDIEKAFLNVGIDWSLPDFPVNKAPPFSKTGVDFAGPLFVKDKSNEMRKVYVALFTCCVTRAVHLELVEDLSVKTFKCCL